MNDREYLDALLDYMLSKKPENYFQVHPSLAAGEKLSPEKLRIKAENDLNSMTRCEYLIAFGNETDVKNILDMIYLAKGKTVTKTYIATAIDDNRKEVKDVC